jgi:hypothetical protein
MLKPHLWGTGARPGLHSAWEVPRPLARSPVSRREYTPRYGSSRAPCPLVARAQVRKRACSNPSNAHRFLARPHPGPVPASIARQNPQARYDLLEWANEHAAPAREAAQRAAKVRASGCGGVCMRWRPRPRARWPSRRRCSCNRLDAKLGCLQWESVAPTRSILGLESPIEPRRAGNVPNLGTCVNTDLLSPCHLLTTSPHPPTHQNKQTALLVPLFLTAACTLPDAAHASRSRRAVRWLGGRRLENMQSAAVFGFRP